MSYIKIGSWKNLVVFGLFASAIAASGCAIAGSKIDKPLPVISEDTTDRLIVKFRDQPNVTAPARVKALGNSAKVVIEHLREMSGNSHVVKLSQKVSRSDARAVAARLRADPSVAIAEVDYRLVAQRIPNDPMYAQQWHYFEPAGGINLPAAWDVTTGSSNIVIAVVDTGILPHADLAGRITPGYDFITDIATANDGDGRDPNPTDSGDYGCNGSNSSWHGTHVAGTIGAASNNSSGVSGINWVSKLLPIRVLGKCGGYTSDIVDGLRWAAGIDIVGVPHNTTPARVANLSLGGANGGCSATFQNAINDVTARGMVVVVAAGNSAADASTFEPASCNGVIAVGATTRNGGKASYSNFGSKVAISAPGGGNGDGVLSTLNSGTTVPIADSYAFYQGTSMGAPHVSGTVSLMLSANQSLTPSQILQTLKQTARPFPTGTGSDCSTTLCGAGIVNAGAALATLVPAPAAPPSQSLPNVALASNGGVATASSTYSAGFPVGAVNNGERMGSNWGSGGGWNDASTGIFPDWVQIDFNGSKSISEIDVFTIQDNYTNPQAPTEKLSFNNYGIVDFEVQYWNGSAWISVPGGSVTGNNKVWRKFAFAPITTNRIRITVLNALASYSRITEIEAYGVDATAAAPAAINVAAQINGASASATSTYSGAFPPGSAIDGDRRGLNWGSGGGWNDATADTFPDSLQVNFNGSKTITEVDVFTVQDAYTNPAEPTPTMLFTQYGITDFDVQYWNGSGWTTLPGGSVTGNNLVWKKISFNAIATTAIRVNVRGALSSYSRITEIEAY